MEATKLELDQCILSIEETLQKCESEQSFKSCITINKSCTEDRVQMNSSVEKRSPKALNDQSTSVNENEVLSESSACQLQLSNRNTGKLDAYLGHEVQHPKDEVTPKLPNGFQSFKQAERFQHPKPKPKHTPPSYPKLPNGVNTQYNGTLDKDVVTFEITENSNHLESKVLIGEPTILLSNQVKSSDGKCTKPISWHKRQPTNTNSKTRQEKSYGRYSKPKKR